MHNWQVLFVQTMTITTAPSLAETWDAESSKLRLAVFRAQHLVMIMPWAMRSSYEAMGSPLGGSISSAPSDSDRGKKTATFTLHGDRTKIHPNRTEAPPSGWAGNHTRDGPMVTLGPSLVRFPAQPLWVTSVLFGAPLVRSSCKVKVGCVAPRSVSEPLRVPRCVDSDIMGSPGR